jgi:hypothetical protein
MSRINDLFDACKIGDIKNVKGCVSKGFDINARSSESHGYTPLMYAVVGGNGNFTKPPVSNGNIDVIMFLVYSGADLQMKNKNENTVFDIVEFNYSEMDDINFKNVKEFLNDINGDTQILALFKILYHKFIYLGPETIFELIQTLKQERLVKGGKKRQTIRRRKPIRKSKRRRL